MTIATKRLFALTMLAGVMAAFMLAGPLWAQTTTASSPLPTSATLSATSPSTTSAPANAVGEIEQTIGSLDPKSGYLFAVKVSNRGAGIQSVKLSKYRQTVEDDQLYERVGKDQKRYEEQWPNNPKCKGNYQLMGPVFEGGAFALPMATRSIDWGLDRGEKTVAEKNFKEDGGLEDYPVEKKIPWEIVAVEKDADGVAYRVSLRAFPKINGEKVLQVAKTYEVKKGCYSIIMRLEVENLTDKPAKIMIDQSGPTGLAKEDYAKDDRNVLFGKIDPKDQHKVGFGIKANAELQNAKDPFPPGYRYIGSTDDPAMPLVWLAADNKFFASSMYLMPRDPNELAPADPGARFYYGEATGASGQGVVEILPAWFGLSKKWVLTDPRANFPPDVKGRIKLTSGAYKWEGSVESSTANTLTISGWSPSDPPAGAYDYSTEIVFFTGMKIGVGWTNTVQEIPGLLLEPHKPATLAFDIFSGPKKRDIFVDPDAMGSEPLYQKWSYVHLLNTQGGSCCSFCVFDWLTLGMMWLLQQLHNTIAFGNYGVAIMLLVLMVRVALHPVTKRSQVSMSKMSKFGPALQELQKKYADDKETLQKETMKFYKAHGATPILGCLPMFLQMPIWIALWTGLSATVELRHAAFLPFWLTDMAAPDRILTWTTDLPLIGHSLNLLPLLGTLSTYLQTKLNPSSMGASATAATPDQQKQQKMMMYMMPIMMLFIFYNMPSGLNLYIMTSGFAGAIEQWVIKRHIAQKQAGAEASEIVIEAPGKASRDVRAKKPKGPFWHKQ